MLPCNHNIQGIGQTRDKSIILYLPITEQHLNSIQCSSTKVQFLNVLTDKCIKFTRMFSATATSFPRYEKNSKFIVVASVLYDTLSTYCSVSFTELIIILHHVECQDVTDHHIWIFGYCVP